MPPRKTEFWLVLAFFGQFFDWSSGVGGDSSRHRTPQSAVKESTHGENIIYIMFFFTNCKLTFLFLEWILELQSLGQQAEILGCGKWIFFQFYLTYFFERNQFLIKEFRTGSSTFRIFIQNARGPSIQGRARHAGRQSQVGMFLKTGFSSGLICNNYTKPIRIPRKIGANLTTRMHTAQVKIMYSTKSKIIICF